MWHLFLYHESSYVWDLILLHIWDAPGFALKSGSDNAPCWYEYTINYIKPWARISSSTGARISQFEPKQKLFFWLFLHDRLNTRDVLKRWNMELESYTCENCILQRLETWSHLFLRYVQLCTEMLADRWNYSPSLNNPHLVVTKVTAELRMSWSTEIVITMMWCIWKCRNGWIFNEILPTIILNSYRMKM
jgi:hypothetical protein